MEIYAGRTIIEVDDLLDIIDLIKVEDNKITSDGKILAEYANKKRADEVFEELCEACIKGYDCYYLPTK